MDITVTAHAPEDTSLQADIVIAAKDVDAAVKKAYKDVAYKYNFPGFRRGRAPRAVVNSLVGSEAVLAQATNDLLNAAEPLVLEELNIAPVGQLTFGEDPDLVVEKQDYKATVSMEIRPAAELDSYDAPSITLPPEEVTDAEVELQIRRLLSYQASYEDLELDRSAEEGDVVSLTIENIEGAERYVGTDMTYELGSERLPKELEAEVLGMKPGESKEVAWTYTHQHEDHTHEHNYKLTVTLNGFKQEVIPELDDEVAKRFGYDSVEAFKKDVHEEVEQTKQNSLPTLKEDRVVAAVGEKLQLEEVPANYKEEVFKELANEVLGQMQRSGMSLDMYLSARGLKTDDFIKDLREQADERARQSLALDAIARKHNFEVDDEDIRAEFERANVPDVDKAIKQWKSEGRLPAIRDSIKRAKALDWLVENCEVTVVDEAQNRLDEQNAEATAKKADSKKSSSKSTSKAKKTLEAEKAEDTKSEDTQVDKPQKKAPAAKKSTAKKSSQESDDSTDGVEGTKTAKKSTKQAADADE